MAFQHGALLSCKLSSSVHLHKAGICQDPTFSPQQSPTSMVGRNISTKKNSSPWQQQKPKEEGCGLTGTLLHTAMLQPGGVDGVTALAQPQRMAQLRHKQLEKAGKVSTRAENCWLPPFLEAASKTQGAGPTGSQRPHSGAGAGNQHQDTTFHSDNNSRWLSRLWQAGINEQNPSGKSPLQVTLV